MIFSGTDGSDALFTFSRLYRETAGSGNELISRVIPVTVLSVLIPIVAFVVILLFKKRRLQLRLTILLLVLEFLLVIAGAAYVMIMVRTDSYKLTPSVNMIFPVVEIILTFLAYRGIKHDEELVRSYDRLR